MCVQECWHYAHSNCKWVHKMYVSKCVYVTHTANAQKCMYTTGYQRVLASRTQKVHKVFLANCELSRFTVLFWPFPRVHNVLVLKAVWALLQKPRHAVHGGKRHPRRADRTEADRPFWSKRCFTASATIFRMHPSFMDEDQELVLTMRVALLADPSDRSSWRLPLPST